MYTVVDVYTFVADVVVVVVVIVVVLVVLWAVIERKKKSLCWSVWTQ